MTNVANLHAFRKVKVGTPMWIRWAHLVCAVEVTAITRKYIYVGGYWQFDREGNLVDRCLRHILPPESGLMERYFPTLMGIEGLTRARLIGGKYVFRNVELSYVREMLLRMSSRGDDETLYVIESS